MKNNPYYFIAPLSNVDDSILGVELEPNFSIGKWPLKRFTDLIYEYFGEDSETLVNENLHYNCCIKEGQNDVFFISGIIDPDDYWKKLPESASFEEEFIDRGGYYGRLRDKIKLIHGKGDAGRKIS